MTCKDCHWNYLTHPCENSNKSIYEHGCAEHCFYFLNEKEVQEEFINSLVEKIAKTLTP